MVTVQHAQSKACTALALHVHLGGCKRPSCDTSLHWISHPIALMCAATHSSGLTLIHTKHNVLLHPLCCQVSIGMGTLAGSTVMLLTIVWGGSVLVGRCDLGPQVGVGGGSAIVGGRGGGADSGCRGSHWCLPQLPAHVRMSLTPPPPPPAAHS